MSDSSLKVELLQEKVQAPSAQISLNKAQVSNCNCGATSRRPITQVCETTHAKAALWPSSPPSESGNAMQSPSLPTKMGMSSGPFSGASESNGEWETHLKMANFPDT